MLLLFLAGKQGWSGLAGKALARLAFPRPLLLLAGFFWLAGWSGSLPGWK
jgi:hypothetical protein